MKTMKKLTILILLFLGSISTLFAQKDTEAAEILKKISAKYKSFEVIKSDFYFTIVNQQASIRVTQTGTLFTKSKTNKFRVTLYGPENAANPIIEQEIISDGKTQWTYLKKNNEVQVTNADNTEEAMNPAKIFTIYEHGYKYIYNGEKKENGIVYQEIDLTPENADKEFFKVRLTIDKLKKQIYSALIFDKNGNKYTITIRNLTGNPPIAENFFTFDVKEHKGVEVVDLK
jgi:outer membrane lipoprotein-sorting protein